MEKSRRSGRSLLKKVRDVEIRVKTTMPDLLIGSDFGSSLTRALYQCMGEKIQLLTMEPELIKLPYSSLKSYRDGMIGKPSPEDDAWVKCSKDVEECIVSGYLARNLRVSTRMDLLKYEQALYKLMAVIGAVAEKAGLPQKFSVGISALLPYSEYTKRNQMELRLEKGLKSFYFRDRCLKPQLQMFDCLPEGGGVAVALMNAKGFDWFARQTLVVLQFGHRDVSCLVFQRGIMQHGSTVELGFNQLVSKVIARTFRQDPNLLAKAIYEIGGDINPDNKILRSLIRSEEASNIEAEVEQLVQVIRAVREEQWLLLQSFLDANVPNELSEISVVGGFAHYLKKEISQYLKWANPRWETELQAEIKKMLCLEKSSASTSEANTLAYRLIDNYGSFTDLVGKQQESSNVA